MKKTKNYPLSKHKISIIRCKEIGDFIKEYDFDLAIDFFKLKPSTIRRYMTDYNYLYDESISSISNKYSAAEKNGQQNIIKKILNFYFDNKCNLTKTLEKFKIKKSSFNVYMSNYLNDNKI